MTFFEFFSDPWHVFASLAAVGLAVSGVPQAIHIWRARSAEDVSTATWTILMVALGVLTVYVWVKVPDVILKAQYALSSIVNAVVVIGIFRFRKKPSG